MESLHALAARASSVNIGRYVVAVLGGGWLALFLASLLGRLRVDVAASIAALSLALVLLFVASWDLLVRWGLLRSLPIVISGPQTRAARLLRGVASWMVLVAGILIGHGVSR